jgi:arylsulfatase A-like enzyme
MPPSPPRRPAGLRVGALVLAALLPACRGVVQTPPPPDVVLVTVDTLRADHVGAYGGSRARTPVMDALAREGTLFENAVSPMPETRPAHFTLFTSLYPRDHGVTSNFAFPRPNLVTLPGLFRDAGYLTVAFVGCALFGERARETLGFDVLDAPATAQRSAGHVVLRAVSFLRVLDADRRFFLWVHLFDPHMPYEPPRSFDPAPASPLAESWPAFTWPGLLAAADERDGNLPPALLERARDLYRGEVEHVDHWLGRLIEALRERGRWESTLVLLAADHGECFSDGVYFEHSQCLGEGALTIPLVLRLPGRVEAGSRVDTPVELLDVGPTLLRLGGLEVPGGFGGSDLLARGRDHTADSRLAFFERPRYLPIEARSRNEALERLRSVAGEPTRRVDPDVSARGVRSKRWEYVVDERGERLIPLSEEAPDGGDGATSRRQALERLRRAADEWQRDHPLEAARRDLTPEQLERLQSLGYFWRAQPGGGEAGRNDRPSP